MRSSVHDHRSRSRQIPAARLYADDNDASTAWIDPNPTVGTKLQFQFPGKLQDEKHNARRQQVPAIHTIRANPASKGIFAFRFGL